jgi:hypothetical protein
MAIRKLYVNGSAEKVGYLFSLKSRKEYRHKAIPIYKGFHFARQQNPDVQFFYTTILQENREVQTMLQKKRTFMPAYLFAGEYHVFCLIPKKSMKSNDSLNFKPIDMLHSDEVIDFLNQNGKEYQYFPYIDANHFTGQSTYKLKFYGLFRNEELLACGALWNQQNYRQLVVSSYGGIYRWIYRISRFLKWFGFPKLSKPGSVVNYVTLSYWMVKNNNKEIFDVFIDHMAYEARKFDLFTVGVHERNSLMPVLRRKTKVVYKSKLYQVQWNGDTKAEINQELIPWLECAQL